MTQRSSEKDVKKSHPVPPASSPFVLVTRTINRPIEPTFDICSQADLTKIFSRVGDLPGIISTTVNEGWNAAGLHRTNTFDDGSTLDEELLGVDRPYSFSYNVSNFSSPALRGAVERIAGRWIFSDNGNDTTNVDWRYTFVPVNDAAKEPIKSYLIGSFQRRLDRALTILKEQLESQSSQ